MVVTSPSKHRSSRGLPSHQLRKEKHKRAACLVAAIGGVAVMTAHASQHVEKQRIHTSAFTGQKWLDELLTGAWHYTFPVL